MDQPLLQLEGINKAFAAPVLKDLSFAVATGEIHALMGSNGAGKSTLCNLVTGLHQPDTGRMSFEGNEHQPQNIKSAEELGIYMVMQELSLFPTLSIAENLCFKSLGNRLGIVRHSTLRQQALKSLELLQLDQLDPDAPVASLSVGQQQLVEISAALSQPVKLLILDEPTASLTDPEIETLFKRLNQMRERGVSVIYISHRMDEISRIADRVSVLRDGELVATRTTAEVSSDEIVNLMAGELSEDDLLYKTNPEKTSPDKTSPDKNNREGHQPRPVLQVDKLTTSLSSAENSFEIRSGEVLGIGGLIGSGRTELLRAIFGADTAPSGGLRFAEDNFQSLRRMSSPKQAISRGIGLVVEDRKSQGLLLSLDISTNTCLNKLADYGNSMGLIDQSAELSDAEKSLRQLATKYDSLDQPVSQLSGGNQQKVLIARWLLKGLDILLFDEPSRGVDARAKASIHHLIHNLALEGKAIVVVSSETDELVKVSDRILVMSNGRLAGEFDASQVTEEQLLDASFKHYSKEQKSNNTDNPHETQTA